MNNETVEAHIASGKARRTTMSRSAHAEWKAPANRPNPVELLKQQALTREQDLVPLRYERMGVSPFTFYRGSALIMASDLSTMPHTNLRVQLCGDAHIANFGCFASPERRLVFDINDFDETLPGPWEWDVKRLAASIEICGRDRGFKKGDRRQAVMTAVKSYREAMISFARMNNMDVWYAHLDVEQELRRSSALSSKKEGKIVLKELEQAYHKTSASAVKKLTSLVDGTLKINSTPPLIVPLSELFCDAQTVRKTEVLIDELTQAYKETLPRDRQHLFEQFSYVDSARKVVGIGSVGTQAWIIVLAGWDQSDPLVLQLKEAQGSVLESFVGASEFDNHGRRVVEGQRLMQASSDVMLGWVRGTGPDGVTRDFYVRQLWDWKSSANLSAIDFDELSVTGAMCGWTLARAHARSGNRIAIASYLGAANTFDKAIADFAASYADQNQADYDAFMQARAAGEL
ncbi:MAG: DUF2252 domain-containing protein [Eggerthellaceae bacterium]